MHRSFGLLGASLLGAGFGLAMACGAAWAQAAPGASLFDAMERPRLVPPPKSKQSPAATACATGGGRVALDARLSACSDLIDSGKWKGKDIAWAYANRAAVHDAQGHADKALADCDKALSLDPDLSLPYQIRGDLRLKRGETDKALADYDAAIRRGARYAAIFIDRGNLLLARGEADRALADFDMALQFNPGSARALVARGGAFFTNGEFFRARKDLDRAIELEPADALAHFNRGSVIFAQGDRAAAAGDFREAARLDPNNVYAALWLFLSGDGAAARDDLKSRTAQASPAVWPRPVAAFFLGEKDAAELLAAASRADERCEAQFYIGAARLLAGAGEEARPYLQRAAEICPRDFSESVQAKTALKSLEPAPPASAPETADPAGPLQK